MRVLLPLRKSTANRNASNSSLSDQSEYSEDEGEHHLFVEGSTAAQQVLVEFPPHASIAPAAATAGAFSEPLLDLSEEADPEPTSSSRTSSFPPRFLPPAGLKSCEEQHQQHQQQLPPPSTATAHSNSLLRKRRPLEDSKPRKRPAPFLEDKKPPPRVLQHQAPYQNQHQHQNQTMGGARRIDWRYAEQDSRDASTPEFMENNPALARGDYMVQNNSNNDNNDNNNNATNASARSNEEDQAMEFLVALKKRGLELREQEGDGNCLFRAVSLQVYGDPSMHGDVRKQCLDFMERDEQHFSQFVTGEPFAQYSQRKRQDGVHGNHAEIQAISELFNRPVEVFCPGNGAAPLNIFHAEYKTDDAPIRLSYHDGNHYNAVVDPLVPTAGLGLGLPGLQPGLADKMQMAKAVAESDAVADQMEFKRALKESQDDELQRAIKESSLSVEHMYSNKAMALSDMDATYFELEQAALERSLQSYSNQEQGKKQQASNGRRRRNGRSLSNDPSVAEESASASDSASVQHPSPNNAVASLPSTCSVGEASIPPAAAASVASVAASRDDSLPAAAIGTVDEYPPTVQELVMNGFDLPRVVRAFELIGDNFDDLLAFLMSNTA